MRMLILSYVILNVCTEFQTPGCSSSWEISDETIIGEKEKWTYKEDGKYENANSLLHDTSSQIPEKSLTQIPLCITLEREVEKG